MRENNIYHGALLRRFFDKFGHISYLGVSICKYMYYPFITSFLKHWNLDWARIHLPYIQEDISRINAAGIHNWSDEPYVYDPHPDGKILLRAGLDEMINTTQFLPKERFFLLEPAYLPEIRYYRSDPTQPGVDLIQTTKLELVPYILQNQYRTNPVMEEMLNKQVSQVIYEQKDDPIFGSHELLEWFQSNLPAIVSLFDTIQAIFDHHNIGAVLTLLSVNAEDGIDSALNLIARANRIPSLKLQISQNPDNWLFTSIPVLTTKTLVWGNKMQNWYQQYGVPESRIAVIGSPRFDIIFNNKWCGKKGLCQKLNFDPAFKIIVYATQNLDFFETNVSIVLNALKSISNVFLIMLLHPGEEPSPYQELCKGYATCSVVPYGKIHLYNALSGADLFITCFSTAITEAILFKIPVITIEPRPLLISYGDWGASLRVTNSDELNQIIIRLISDETFRVKAIRQSQEFITDYCIPDGLASKRLFEEVEILCRSGGCV